MVVLEFDIDGVLYDIIKALGSVSPKLEGIGFNENNVETYNFKGVSDEYRNEIFAQLKNPEVFGCRGCFYDGTFEMLMDALFLLNSCCANNYKIIFHTMVSTQECAVERNKLINHLLFKLGRACGRTGIHMTGVFEAQVDVGVKEHIASDIIVDDCLEYLVHENERNKYRLVPRRHYINGAEIEALRGKYFSTDDEYHTFLRGTVVYDNLDEFRSRLKTAISACSATDTTT